MLREKIKHDRQVRMEKSFTKKKIIKEKKKKKKDIYEE